jgi:hypothetical protein
MVKRCGVMGEDPNSAYLMAKRAYMVIDKQGIVRHKHTTATSHMSAERAYFPIGRQGIIRFKRARTRGRR